MRVRPLAVALAAAGAMLAVMLAAVLGTTVPAQAAPALQPPRLSVVDSESWASLYSDGNRYYTVRATFSATYVPNAVFYYLHSRFDGGYPSIEGGAPAQAGGPVTIPFIVEGLDLRPHKLRFWAVACADYSHDVCSAPSNVVTIRVPARRSSWTLFAHQTANAPA